MNVYVVALVSPVIVWVVAVELNVLAGCATEPTYGVTTYPVIADPLFAGAVHDTAADPFPGSAAAPAGATRRPHRHRSGLPPTAARSRWRSSPPP